MSRLLLLCCITLFLWACGGKSKKDQPKGNSPKTNSFKVDAYIAGVESFADNIEVPGTLIANEATEVHPEVAGRLTYLNVRDGQYVHKGNLLAKLYDGDLQAQLKKIEIQLSIAKKTEERQAQLLRIQGISQQDYDLSLLQVNSLNADIDIIKTAIQKTQIRAPFSGRLSLKEISPGAYVTPASVITIINQTDQLKLDFNVPEKYSGRIKTGQVISFSFEGSIEIQSAKIIATEPTITENSRSLKVRAIVIRKSAALLPGSFAKVQLSFAPVQDAILIPTQAILLQARGKKVILFNAGVARFVEITTGARDSARVQITSGLKPGDTVVITGLLSVRPEAKIQLATIVNRQ